MGEFGKFFILGAFSTALDYMVFATSLAMGMDYAVAIIFGYSTGLVFNYYAGRRYIFTSGTKLQKNHYEFVAVSLIAVFGLLINIAIVKLLSFYIWQIDPYLSRIVAIAVAFVWNYVARKLFVYH
jgi:putative flippase GtrA